MFPSFMVQFSYKVLKFFESYIKIIKTPFKHASLYNSVEILL